MPEGPEVETETLMEKIHEEVEHDGGALLKRIALSTALFAALAAIAALKAGATVNEALVLKTEATRFQAEASDQWAYYQAKGIKAATAEASRTSWLRSAASRRPSTRRNRSATSRSRRKSTRRHGRRRRAGREVGRRRTSSSTTTTGSLTPWPSLPGGDRTGAVAALTKSWPVWAASLLLPARPPRSSS
jgi:hypothetical protein